MSEVISFRLNPDNTREARALRVLQRLQIEGHNTRHIVTEALLLLGDSDKDELNAKMLAQLNEKLDQVSQILQIIEHEKSTSGITINQSISEIKLSKDLLNAIKETAKPGIRIE